MKVVMANESGKAEEILELVVGSLSGVTDLNLHCFSPPPTFKRRPRVPCSGHQTRQLRLAHLLLDMRPYAAHAAMIKRQPHSGAAEKFDEPQA
jgi:hypothetical protein